MKKVLIVILVLILVVVGAVAYKALQTKEDDYVKFTGKTWYDYGIGQYIPTMKLRSGKTPQARGVVNNSDTAMFFQIDNASKLDDFDDYVALLMDSGFVYNVERTNREYKASDEDGHRVRVYNWTNGTITVEASMEKK